ncbi:hypothetical protein IB286_12720 [Spongiibacter sp. KMU-158]|uniref:Cation transporter n=1 Tax=Spongiibacter pelagi TaxID=2760804 RepID=A0A927C506_9GAMM|nr:hypothetical protein [Spongiibacter pelagi]MBD2859866.1 hypothetical protein [Spongiibacter pelagi]
MTTHRFGINPGFLAKHKVKLHKLDPTNASKILAEIDELPWIDQVSLNSKNGQLKMVYEASHHNIDEMIAIIEKHGASISNDFWSRIKLGWQRQIDENIKDNAKHEAACCSKIPPGYRRK